MIQLSSVNGVIILILTGKFGIHLRVIVTKVIVKKLSDIAKEFCIFYPPATFFNKHIINHILECKEVNDVYGGISDDCSGDKKCEEGICRQSKNVY